MNGSTTDTPALLTVRSTNPPRSTLLPSSPTFHLSLLLLLPFILLIYSSLRPPGYYIHSFTISLFARALRRTRFLTLLC